MSDKKEWTFCETPEEKCTMNYCDENGCQNRERVLVDPIDKQMSDIEEIREAKVIIAEMVDIMPYRLDESIKPYIIEAMGVYAKPLQQTIDKLTKEVEGLRAEWDLSEKAHSLSIEDRIKVVQENTKLKEENERLFKMDLEKLKDLAISEEMVKDLNQLATDRGNEVHKLKEQLKELEDGIVFGLDFNMQNNHKEYFKQLLTKQQ